MINKYINPAPSPVEIDKMKLAVQILLFGQEKWIMRTLENAYNNVDHIYIAYSKMPWTYNQNARATYTNTFDLEKIKNSPFIDKITIVEGDWFTEEGQRNALLNSAITDGYQYMLIQDADEFYFDSDYQKIKEFIKKHPSYNTYTAHMYNFWKSFTHIILGPVGQKETGEANVVINLSNTRFSNKRNPNFGNKINIPDVRVYHGSYVLNDSELLEKFKTWGHHNDFNIYQWYENVFQKWTIDSVDLHPLEPHCWSKVVSYDGELPEIIKKYYCG
jgi:hypothetical protein